MSLASLAQSQEAADFLIDRANTLSMDPESDESVEEGPKEPPPGSYETLMQMITGGGVR